MRKRVTSATLLGLICLVAGKPAWALQAQPVPIPEEAAEAPQLEIAGAGTVTLNSLVPGAKLTHNLSDNALVVGAAERLYNNAIGSFGLGALTLDQANRGLGSGLFLHQAFLSYQTSNLEITLGRSDNRGAHLVDFPTLRGDDLITFTNPMNPYANGQNPEEHRYANVASVTFNQNLTWFEDFHAQHLINSAGTGDDLSVSSMGVTLEYLGAPGLEAVQSVPSWGLGYEYLPVTDRSFGANFLPLHQFYAGGTLNLNRSVTDRVDLLGQEIVTLGNGMTSVQSLTDTYQANSNATALALRYYHAPFGEPGYQISLTGGLKNYLQAGNSRTAGVAITGVKQLGRGFSLVGQYQGQWANPGYAAVMTGGEPWTHILDVGLQFNFNATFNRHIAPRRSLLNQQFQYIPE